MDEALSLLDIAHRQYRLTMEDYRRRRQGYLAALAYAREQGASYAMMAKVVGSTRQKVYRLLNGGE